MIEPVPQNAAEGESVLLQVYNLPEDLRAFSWYKGVYSTQSVKIAEYSSATNIITWGPVHSGRETLYTNGSLLLRHITKKDAGFYLLQTSDRDFKVEKVYLQLHVNSK
ncbi:carcinoembryonic antigen-related cell adhesion molecule 3-like [Sigmodon hispidus]